MPGGLLVIADSLAFHGPEQAELLTHPGLWPNVAAAQLGVAVDVVARQGWTARDAWWALTKDPYVYSVLLPRAGAVVLAVGNMDHLPASIPTYLREGLAYLRPDRLRHAARRAYLAAHPRVVRLLRGRLRVLPQRLTDAYLSQCVQALRLLRPDLAIVGVVPPGFDSPYYGHVDRTHPPAVAAARAWGSRESVPLVDLDALAAAHLAEGRHNPDGMHWGWELHAEVGRSVAATVARLWAVQDSDSSTTYPPFSGTGNQAGGR